MAFETHFKNTPVENAETVFHMTPENNMIVVRKGAASLETKNLERKGCICGPV